MERLRAEFPIKALVETLEVSRSGYYKWRHHMPTPRQQANNQLLESIRQIHEKSRKTYGSPRITRQLQRQQVACSENRVARLMRVHQICARRKRPFRPRTTQSGHWEAPAPNRLKELPVVAAPDQAWAADITYVRILSGWVYLAAVMDLYSRKIVGWSVDQSLGTSLVKRALEQAWFVRRPAPGLLHHSDRGIQYASSAFRALLASYEIVPSMSAKGNCYDNAAMESFWSTLKTELIQGRDFATPAEARLAIFEYIETFYNRRRLHSALGYKSPVEFEQQITYKKT
jgi:transposase InsO family protein